jgi:hypothetical protein
MTTPIQLYMMLPQETHNRVRELVGVYYNHIPEVVDADGLAWDATSPRVQIRVIKRFDFDGRRYWQLATVWFDDKPVMIIQNAGREGDDHRARFITDPELYAQMCTHIASLIINVQQLELTDVVDINDDIDGLTEFYGNELNGPFERYRY